MVIKEISKVQPAKDLVVIELVNLDDIHADLLSTQQSDEDSVAVRYGKVTSMGPEVQLPEHCQGLKVGDIAAFTEFAGNHIASNDDKMYKLIRGYDIIGICNTMDDIKNAAARPTANRLLVEEVDQNEGSDIILNGSMDPRVESLGYGKVTGLGPNIKNKDLTIGLIVAYQPYVGTIIREEESEEKKKLRIIVEEDILMTVVV